MNRTSLIKFAGILLTSLPTPVTAQVVQDNTLPNNSVVTPQGNTIQIDEGTRKNGNLFHSFEKFSVRTGETVSFNNVTDIQNIFSRVTGNEISKIDGIIKANGAANLFLLNPNGIIFGPNASLNVGGSFLATTANSIRFADGFEFSATASQVKPLLTITAPVGLGFEQISQSITGTGAGTDEPFTLKVPKGETLALVGSGIALTQGILIAEEGQIELGSVAGNSLVRLFPNEKGWELSYEEDQKFQDINLSEVLINTTQIDNTGRSYVQIKGENVRFTDFSVVQAGTSAKAGGTLTVDASESITIEDSTLSTLSVNNNKVSTFNEVEGKAGNLRIRALESVELSGVFSEILAEVGNEATGDAGNITIETEQLIVRDGAYISTTTSGAGDAGNITIETEQLIVRDGAYISTTTSRAGDAGNITIEAKQLNVRDGTTIEAATFGTGNAGSLIVRADSIELSGASDSGRGGLFASAIEGTGDGGNLSVFTDKLIVKDGATISVSNRQSRNLGLPGSGSPGNLNIQADTILLDEGTITAETAAGDRGNITLKTSNLVLREGSRITTNSQNTDGGNIFIDTDLLIASDNSDITANAQRGAGGRVTVNAEGIFGIQAREQLTPESDITATSALGVEFSGEVTINTPDVDLSSELVKLPTAPVETEVAQACAPSDVEEQSEFIITGRGGLPPTPREVLTINPIEADWVIAPEETSSRPKVSVNPTASPPAQIVEAQGWTVDNKGEVWFVADASTSTAPPRLSGQKSTSCHSHEIN